MTLGSYEPPVRMQGDQFKAVDNQGKPLIVIVREYKEKMRTKHNPDGDGRGIFVDVADLLGDTIYIDVLWMGGAVVDGLRPHVGSGTPLPIKIIPAQGSGNTYLTLSPLEGAERQLAEGWYAKNPSKIADTRAAREAEAKPLGTVTPAAPVTEGPVATPAAPAPAPVATPVAAAPSASMNEDAVAAALARLNS